MTKFVMFARAIFNGPIYINTNQVLTIYQTEVKEYSVTITVTAIQMSYNVIHFVKEPLKQVADTICSAG